MEGKLAGKGCGEGITLWEDAVEAAEADDHGLGGDGDEAEANIGSPCDEGIAEEGGQLFGIGAIGDDEEVILEVIAEGLIGLACDLEGVLDGIGGLAEGDEEEGEPLEGLGIGGKGSEGAQALVGVGRRRRIGGRQAGLETLFEIVEAGLGIAEEEGFVDFDESDVGVAIDGALNDLMLVEIKIADDLSGTEAGGGIEGIDGPGLFGDGLLEGRGDGGAELGGELINGIAAGILGAGAETNGEEIGGGICGRIEPP